MLRNGGRNTSISVRNVYMVIEVAVKNYTHYELGFIILHKLSKRGKAKAELAIVLATLVILINIMPKKGMKTKENFSFRKKHSLITTILTNQRECSLKKKHSLHAHSHSNVLIPLNQRANGMNLSVCMCVRAREHLYADQIGSILAWQRRQAKPFPLHVTATMFS